MRSWMLLLCLFFPTLCEAQSLCKLSLQDAPTPLGLNLGESPAEVSNALGRTVKTKEIASTIRITRYGTSGLASSEERSTVHPIGEALYSYYPSDTTNRGQLYFRFWKDKLYTIALEYDSRDFGEALTADAVAKKLNLPFEGWEGLTLRCHGFYVAAVPASGGVQIEITDVATKDEIREATERTISSEKRYLKPDSDTWVYSTDDPPVLKKPIAIPSKVAPVSQPRP